MQPSLIHLQLKHHRYHPHTATFPTGGRDSVPPCFNDEYILLPWMISHMQLRPSYERMDYPLGEMNDSQMTGELENIIVPEYSTCETIWFTSYDDHHVVFAGVNKTNTELSLSYLPRKKTVDMKVHKDVLFMYNRNVHKDALFPNGF